MEVRTDPFQVLDRLTQQWFGTGLGGGASRSAGMPMDAYRFGDEFVVHFDLPGVSPESIDVDVQHHVLTVTARRDPIGRGKADDTIETLVSERPTGTFSRQLYLGDTLDTDNIQAGYDAGVLTLHIPVAAQAKPRRISITSGKRREINA